MARSGVWGVAVGLNGETKYSVEAWWGDVVERCDAVHTCVYWCMCSSSSMCVYSVVCAMYMCAFV